MSKKPWSATAVELGQKGRAELDSVAMEMVRKGMTWEAARQELLASICVAAAAVHKTQPMAAKKLNVHVNTVWKWRRRGLIQRKKKEVVNVAKQ